MSIRVTLLDSFRNSATELAQHAGNTCYMPEMPTIGESKLNVENQLFNTSHHTTITHPHFMFGVEGVSVNAFTFGLHLSAPFYNSDQRSGRFCSEMFENKDIAHIEEYIRSIWTDVSQSHINLAMDFIRHGLDLYIKYLPEAVLQMEKQIKAERPNASESYIQRSAKKFAQEQLRMLVSTIYPTAADYTLSLTGLVQLWHAAWSRELREITNQMRDAVLQKDPNIAYMFKEENRCDLWTPDINPSTTVCLRPSVRVMDKSQDYSYIVIPNPKDMHPIDLLQYHPKYMSNNSKVVHTEIMCSIATMGQDQRHRTIHRSQPKLTGNFYSPWVISMCVKDNELFEFIRKFEQLFISLPADLVFAIAPYGSMVKYEKIASVNAFAHEMTKRTCWCAQEEISNMALLLRMTLTNEFGNHSNIVKLINPPCYNNGGKCVEGSRYCGRKIIKCDDLNADECFIMRTI